MKIKLFKYCDDLSKDHKEQVLIENIKGFSDRKLIIEGLEYIEKKLPNCVVLFYTIEQSKINIFTNVPNNLTNKIKAGEWLSECCKILGGKGGGKDTQAQGQGADISKIDEMVSFAKSYSKKKLE